MDPGEEGNFLQGNLVTGSAGPSVDTHDLEVVGTNLPMGHPPPVPGAEARRNLFYQELRVGDREVVPECQRGGFLVLILLAVISVLSCWLPRRSA